MGWKVLAVQESIARASRAGGSGLGQVHAEWLISLSVSDVLSPSPVSVSNLNVPPRVENVHRCTLPDRIMCDCRLQQIYSGTEANLSIRDVCHFRDLRPTAIRSCDGARASCVGASRSAALGVHCCIPILRYAATAFRAAAARFAGRCVLRRYERCNLVCVAIGIRRHSDSSTGFQGAARVRRRKLPQLAALGDLPLGALLRDPLAHVPVLRLRWSAVGISA